MQARQYAENVTGVVVAGATHFIPEDQTEEHGHTLIDFFGP